MKKTSYAHGNMGRFSCHAVRVDIPSIGLIKLTICMICNVQYLVLTEILKKCVTPLIGKEACRRWSKTLEQSIQCVKKEDDVTALQHTSENTIVENPVLIVPTSSLYQSMKDKKGLKKTIAPIVYKLMQNNAASPAVEPSYQSSLAASGSALLATR